MLFKNTLGLILLILFSFNPVSAIFLHESCPAEQTQKKVVHQHKTDKPNRTPTMNYQKWVSMLAKVVRLINKVEMQDQLEINLNLSSDTDIFLFSNVGSAIVQMQVISIDLNQPLLNYTIIPWQDFSVNTENPTAITQQLLTANDYAVFYSSHPALSPDSAEQQYSQKFEAAFKQVINYDQNQSVTENEQINIPEDVQVISADVYPYYIDLQVALPGSKLPEFSKWKSIAKNKMLHLSLVPDMGEVKSSWIKTNDSEMNVYYTSVEEKLLQLFSDAIDQSLKHPDNRQEIFNKAKNKLRTIFNATNSYVNYLYNEYEERLKRWLLLDDQVTELPVMDEIFADYQPKRTPDTMLDFMPELAEEFKKLPGAQPENITQLLNLLTDFRQQAEKNPGQWQDGNMILGAKPKEYFPSQPELLAAETGSRLQSIVNSTPKEQLQQLLEKAEQKITNIKFTKFTFTHMDVIGSGRFFYVETIEKVKITFE